MNVYRCAILGATGLVGQRLIERLQSHPWFEIRALAASERSTGRHYRDAVTWRLPSTLSPSVGEIVLRPCTADTFEDCDLAFSALDTDVARELEPSLAAKGLAVVSNSSAFRQAEGVPLLVPDVNAGHVDWIGAEDGAGFIATNPNCSIAGLAVAVAPLHRRFGLRRMVVATLQAISGAGAAGPRALDLTDNVLPHIPGEEEKIEQELRKILGRLDGSTLERAAIDVSAHCHRVPVIDGHLEAVSMELESTPSVDEAIEVLEQYRGPAIELGLPSAPDPPLIVRREPDRPQPRLDRDAGEGMAVTVGRVRPCPVLGLKLELLSHNTVRGAAGGTVLVAELLARRDRLPRRSGS